MAWPRAPYSSACSLSCPELKEEPAMEVPQVQGLWDWPAMLFPGKELPKCGCDLSQKVNRTLWQVVRCPPAVPSRPGSTHNHVRISLRILKEQQKKWLFRKNLIIWDFTALWLVSVGLQRLFNNEGREKKSETANLFHWLLVLSSSLLHISVVCPFCHHSLSRLWVRCETRPSWILLWWWFFLWVGLHSI